MNDLRKLTVENYLKAVGIPREEEKPVTFKRELTHYEDLLADIRFERATGEGRR